MRRLIEAMLAAAVAIDVAYWSIWFTRRDWLASEHTQAYYDFEAKYIDSTPGLVPAPLTPKETAEVQRLAVDAFDAASCEGLVRADFFLTEDGEFVINEINTMPGFTPISMYPQMWQASGVSYPELIDRLVQAALRRSTGLR